MKKKLAGVIVTLFCVIAFITLYFLFGGKEETVTSFQFAERILVTEGEADITVREIPFMLEKSGTYTMYAQWEPDKYALGEEELMADAGMITGLVVYNPAGEIVFCTTGESVDAESTELELKAGEYIVQYRYLTNAEGLDALVAEADATSYDTEAYTYAENAAFETEYHFKITSNIVDVWICLALVIGVCVGLVLVVIILIVTKKDKKLELQYDERQMQERGNAFKLGFFTQLIYMCFMSLCYVVGIQLPVATEVILFFGVLLSLSVYVVYCIWKEAYIALNETVKKVNIVFVIIGIVNVFIGVMHCIHGNMIENGILTFRCINLLCGVFLLLVAIVIGSVELAKKREDD